MRVNLRFYAAKKQTKEGRHFISYVTQIENKKYYVKFRKNLNLSVIDVPGYYSVTGNLEDFNLTTETKNGYTNNIVWVSNFEKISRDHDYEEKRKFEKREVLKNKLKEFIVNE